MRLGVVVHCLVLLFCFKVSAGNVNASKWTVAHWGECLMHEIAYGFQTGMRWYNAGHAGPELRVVCLKPTDRASIARSESIHHSDKFAIGCLLAKGAAGVPATINESNQWSSVESSNGHDERSWSIKCERQYSNPRFISLATIEDMQYRGCAAYDVATKRYRKEIVDRFIQNESLQFRACIKTALSNLQRAGTFVTNRGIRSK